MPLLPLMPWDAAKRGWRVPWTARDILLHRWYMEREQLLGPLAAGVAGQVGGPPAWGEQEEGPGGSGVICDVGGVAVECVLEGVKSARMSGRPASKALRPSAASGLRIRNAVALQPGRQAGKE